MTRSEPIPSSPNEKSEQLSDDLQSQVAERYGLDIHHTSRIKGGEEADAWRIDTPSTSIFLRVDRPERRLEEVLWINDLITFVAERTGKSVAPLPARDGATTFEHAGRTVVVAPYVEGKRLGRLNVRQVDMAATTLAGLHEALKQWRGPNRPTPSLYAPVNFPASLDQWVAAWERQGNLARPHGPIHGD